MKAIPKVEQNLAVERYIKEQSPELIKKEKEAQAKKENKKSTPQKSQQ